MAPQQPRPLDGDALLTMRILVGAGGTVTAQSVIKALRLDDRATFVAAVDMDPMNATKAFVDAFVQVPPATSPGYARACLDAARQLKIDLFIPLIVEKEFLPLDAVRAEFERLGCRLWVPERSIVRKTGDKLAFAQFLAEVGIPGPRTVEYSTSVSGIAFPAYVKPRHGSGSVGTVYVTNEYLMHEAAKGRSDLIVQEAAAGKEFTVDCFAGQSGRVAAAVPRERIAVKAGVSVKGRTYHHPEIERIASEVVEKSGIVGPANVQGMLADDGSFSVIEMNPRFSGTLALTTAAGINFASLLLDCAQGKTIPDLRGRHRAGVTMVRYWSELFEMPDGSTVTGTLLPPQPSTLNSPVSSGATSLESSERPRSKRSSTPRVPR
ncbi:MAG: ATP-grasp domain-containing protein [Candidatus Eremiobacteraeota bacterium]|nr:ATP-grasp domain-containing protein [Candidatus Eremiobacteraeota bacterium]